MANIELVLPTYFAIRVAVGFNRWGVVADVTYITLVAFLMWQNSPLYLLSLPFYLAVVAIGGGVFRNYAGLASALSISGVYLMFQQPTYLKGLGFLFAILAPAALVATVRDRGSLEGFFRYLVVSTFASSFLFIGLGQRSTAMGEAFILMAVALELGVAPMFLWVPDVYGRTHPAGLAILASLPKLSATFALLAIRPETPAVLFYALGALSMAVGNLGALTSVEPRRILAYSTVTHTGFAIFIYPIAPEVTLALVLADAFGKMGLFYALNTGTYRWTTRILVLHQIGLPPLFGFWPKAALVILVAEKMGTVYALYVLANIVAMAPYYFRLMEVITEGKDVFPAAVGIIIAAIGVTTPLWFIYHVSSLL